MAGKVVAVFFFISTLALMSEVRGECDIMKLTDCTKPMTDMAQRMAADPGSVDKEEMCGKYNTALSCMRKIVGGCSDDVKDQFEASVKQVSGQAEKAGCEISGSNFIRSSGVMCFLMFFIIWILQKE